MLPLLLLCSLLLSNILFVAAFPFSSLARSVADLDGVANETLIPLSIPPSPDTTLARFPILPSSSASSSPLPSSVKPCLAAAAMTELLVPRLTTLAVLACPIVVAFCCPPVPAPMGRTTPRPAGLSFNNTSDFLFLLTGPVPVAAPLPLPPLLAA